MKKWLMMMILLLIGTVSAGIGYYLFVHQSELVVDEVEEAELTSVEGEQSVNEFEPEPESEVQMSMPEVQVREYYVAKPRIAVRESLEEQAFAERELFRGDKVVVLEQVQGWGRISSYFVYHEGGEEVAEWVKLDQLQLEPPETSKEERYEALQWSIQGSDDYLLYQQAFTQYSDQLIEEKRCDLLDFEESSGWMRSINYPDRQVYFVYCGGLLPSDKVYIDVENGEIFSPSY